MIDFNYRNLYLNDEDETSGDADTPLEELDLDEDESPEIGEVGDDLSEEEDQ